MSDAILIRPALPTDAEAMLAMRQALWPDPDNTHRDEIARYFTEDPRDAYLPAMILVAVNTATSALVGFAELSRRSIAEECTTSPVAFLEGWYVVPAWRQRGVGRALMQGGEAWARAIGCSEFASNAEADNHDSAAAHRALGFEDLGLIRSFRKEL